MGASVCGSSSSKHKHARYGNWCVYQIRNRDSLHSGYEIIFSVYLKARYNLQTDADQQGEQSQNKDAKTSGPWEGLTKPEILIPCCQCATLGNSTMSANAHGLLRSWSHNHASQMLLQSWRMSMSTHFILH